MQYNGMKIQMVDLHNQYLKIKPEIDLAIQQVIDSSEFVKGSIVKEFEQNLASYLNVKHVIACANGTDALQIALMALGLKPGDEVITSPFTFIATAETIALLGLVPVFVDVDLNTFNIDCKKIEKQITPRTKAILPVHLFGQSCDMIGLGRIAQKHKLYIIEDAAQSIGSTFKYPCGTDKFTGTLGDIGCTSFFPTKNLGCFGDGGALFTNNDEWAEKIRIIANHGMKERYYHQVIGVNSRLDSIQAAVLNVKLNYLDKYIESRKIAANFYINKLKKVKEIQLPSIVYNHVFHQFTLVVKKGDRNDLKKFLNERGIPAMIYYPVPLHKQKAFDGIMIKNGDLANTEYLSDHVISLPMHTELDNEQLDYICNTIIEYFN
jgi:UDP-2-acetamido-2-deoxy-ribo-hexuluronate aminotransferase